jgi:ABC-type transport system involved in multi-copper enzyme maturation permease subunit
MNRPAIVVWRKEMSDAFRSRLLVSLILGLGIVIILSLVIASVDFHAKLLDYQNYVNALKQAGSAVTAQSPQLFPLQLLRGTIEYLEIIGAIVAIVIGYSLAAKEKNRGTAKLLLSRPLRSFDIATGKLLALAVIWLIVMTALGLIVAASLLFISGSSLAAADWLRLVLVICFAWMYLFMWSSLALGLAGYTKQLGTALVVCLILWLCFVLVIPQVGDTMDPDNQVPGGLFKSLQVAKPREKAVMAHFTSYEAVRNLIEESSISKHFERAGFAVTGVKDTYNQKSLAFIWRDRWSDAVWLITSLILAAALAVISSGKRNLLGKGAV